MVVFRLFAKRRHSNERSSKFESIYQESRENEVRSGSLAKTRETKTSFGSRETLKETYLESILKVLGRKIIFYVFILIFPSEISLVIPLGHFSA